jgi:hypothetical protein
MEKVFTGAADERAISATTALESTPPLRNAPTGTSATMRSATASSSSPRASSTARFSLIRSGRGANDSRQYRRSFGSPPGSTVNTCAGGSL